MPPSAPPNQGTPTRGLAHFPTSRIVGHIGACHSDIDNFLSMFAAPSGASCSKLRLGTRLGAWGGDIDKKLSIFLLRQEPLVPSVVSEQG